MRGWQTQTIDFEEEDFCEEEARKQANDDQEALEEQSMDPHRASGTEQAHESHMGCSTSQQRRCNSGLGAILISWDSRREMIYE